LGGEEKLLADKDTFKRPLVIGALKEVEKRKKME